MLKKVFRSAQSNVELETLTKALFVSQTAEKGGAELFLIDAVKAGGSDWNACFLGGLGPAVDELRAAGFDPLVFSAESELLSVKRGASLLQLLSVSRALITAAFRLAAKAKHYDVLCANSQKAMFVCALASKLCGKPLVWCLHDIVTDESFSAVNRKAVVLFSWLFARVVVVNSKATAESFQQIGGQASKVRLVYNGFSVTGRPQASAELGAKLREILRLDDRPVVGVFSRLSTWKGQHVLLEALGGLPDVQAILVGGALFGEEAYAQNLHQMVEELGLSNRVHFLGFRSDIAELMASVDIVVHTSTAPEPFGRVVVEGMLSKRPVIAAAAGGVYEIIRDNETGVLVPPGNVAALAQAIARLVSDHALRLRLGYAGCADAAERFSMQRCSEGLAGVFREVSGCER